MLKSNSSGDNQKMGDVLFNNRITSEYLLPTKVAARILGMSTNALRIRVCRGQIHAYKLGNQLRFKLRDLRRVLQEKENC